VLALDALDRRLQSHCADRCTATADTGGPLVTGEWLEKNLANPKVRIVEVSVEPGLYERGHIPGAQNIVWTTDLVDRLERDIAKPENFQALVKRLGINDDSTVVLYGDNNNWFAAWGAWVFDVYGVKNVKLLDGGRRKWEAEKRPLDSKVAALQPGNLTISAPNTRLRARLADVLEASRNNNAVIVDIRSPDEFSGKVFAPPGSQELSVRGGPVPGAVNVPWSKAVAAALAAGQLRPQWPDGGQIARGLAGGVLLGWGAMAGRGCTVGTLLSGIMAGALSGWVFAAAITLPIGRALRLLPAPAH